MNGAVSFFKKWFCKKKLLLCYLQLGISGYHSTLYKAANDSVQYPRALSFCSFWFWLQLMIGPLLVSWPDCTCCLVCDTCAPLFCVFLSCYCSNVLCAVVTCIALTEGYHCLSGLISLLPVTICHCYICGTECRSESLTDSVWVCFAHTHTHTHTRVFVRLCVRLQPLDWTLSLYSPNRALPPNANSKLCLLQLNTHRLRSQEKS